MPSSAPTTLTEARRLSDSGEAIALWVSYVEDHYEELYIRCAVSLIHCSESVLSELIRVLNRDVLGFPSAVDSDCGRLQVQYVYYDPAISLTSHRGLVVDGAYIGRELAELGLAVPLARILFGAHADLVSAVIQSAKENSQLFGLMERLIDHGSQDFLMRLLLEGVNPNIRSERGMTPLFIACRQGNMELIRFLLRCGADANSQDVDGCNALQFTLTLIPFNEDDRKRDNDAEIVRILATAGATADVDAPMNEQVRFHAELEREHGPLPPNMWMSRTREEMIDLLRQAGIAAS